MPRTVLLFLVPSVLLLLLSPISCLGNLYEYCLWDQACGGFYFEYPFGKTNSGCGDPEFQVDCLIDYQGGRPGGLPVIDIHGGKYHIMEPFLLGNKFNNNVMTIVNDNLWGGKCNLSGNYSRFWWPGSHFRIAHGYTNLTLWGLCDKSNDAIYQLTLLKLCSEDWYYDIWRPEEATRFCKTHLQIPIKNEHLQFISNLSFLWYGFEITWQADHERNLSCEKCLKTNGSCGYDHVSESKTFLCYCPDGTSSPDKCLDMNVPEYGPYGEDTHDPNTTASTTRGKKTINGAAIGVSVAVVLIAAGLLVGITLYGKRRKPAPRSSISKVEEFLKKYSDEMPTRYSLSRLKKMTNSFAEKLGEGGFGVVYKGKLENGTLVAVKLLDRHRHSESPEFINEVATIGRVHHVNLVRLLGYCFESFTSALVYEFMHNGSLEKFIFAGKERGRVLNWEQLYSIALGAARGFAYLHQDCDKRIIHFDIKPHNILLDADFTPKVSDFGLAKLCGKGDDHISMTAARGTPGYVAPEVCDRDVGPVTDKSDVYSFGMLLLEIVGERKNFDWKVSRSSQFYFLEWAFKRLESGELGMRLKGDGELEAEEEEKARRLTKVGLWCIQYNYRDRPSMSRVVQMLERDGCDVANPPLPWNSSSAAPEIPLLSSAEESCSIEIGL